MVKAVVKCTGRELADAMVSAYLKATVKRGRAFRAELKREKREVRRFFEREVLR